MANYSLGEVDSKANFSRKFILNNLESGSTYSLLVEARPENGGAISAQMKGKFKTPPDTQTSKKIVFAASTCQGYLIKTILTVTKFTRF